jgi:hypothetical protein
MEARRHRVTNRSLHGARVGGFGRKNVQFCAGSGFASTLGLKVPTDPNHPCHMADPLQGFDTPIQKFKCLNFKHKK